MDYDIHLRHTGDCLVYDGRLDKWATIIPESIPIVKEFVLPDKWYVRLTIENKSAIENWRTCGTMRSTAGYIHSEYPKGTIGYITRLEPLEGHVEITNEQFFKYVIKEPLATITKLPFGNLEFTIHKGVTNYDY